MTKKYLTISPVQTKKLGEILAREILKTKPNERALIIGLEGDLGGGKTTFLQGLAKGLGIKEKILSSTFVIMRKFQIPNYKSKIPKFKTFYHLDCYRIKKPKEILDLGFKEIISNPKNIVAIEWADCIRRIIPKQTLWFKFKILHKNQRQIMIR
jgi:tRNA threonylcarbamoyladenosine biosynthesis protein TsaE